MFMKAKFFPASVTAPDVVTSKALSVHLAIFVYLNV